jgi:hypothetical protein
LAVDPQPKVASANPSEDRWKERLDRWNAYMDAGPDQSSLGRARRDLQYMIDAILATFDNRLKKDGDVLGAHAYALATTRKEFSAHLKTVENDLVGSGEEDGTKTADKKIYDLYQLIFDLSVICSLEPWSVIAAIEGKRMQASVSREAKAAKREPQSQATKSAITKLRGDQVSKHPTTEAKRIVDRVNDALARDGFAPVSVHVVRRHLEKFARS